MSVSTSPTAAGLWRRSRATVAVALLVVATAVFGALLAGGDQGRYLDPDDTSLRGSRALAELLRDRGVRVDRVDSVATAESLAREGDRLLLVGAPWNGDYSEAERLADISGDLVVVGDQPYLDVLAPAVEHDGQARLRSREPGCRLPAARAAGSAYLGGLTFKASGDSCYAGSLAVAGTVTVLGSGEFMTNQRLAEDGNAALALNLLGSRKAVTWLVPAPPRPGDDQLAGPGGRSIGELMPDNVPWAVLMAAIAVVVVALWQGRRLGPVVAERLPVVVRAAETVEGRGRLYRARRARVQAAEALRGGALDRLTPRLGLGGQPGADEVVAALAARTGLEPGHLGAALYGPPPADDAGLVALAGYLDEIERQVREH
ncbi:DUF4350 domain-containing protein [Nonomuraea africana]|uniref:DUF4350 domain-containing protein n=1 Tax=Nonomuraea africana TaxID=46171 RepID=A0ABR9KUP6_9ACTN|nr:DUF4350 domain-containing protein [Nonomuraea africana]MBE1565757.1 hypothetical protein [Nonomuraea africana]